MLPGFHFSSTDREELERRRITLREAKEQLALLVSPPPPVILRRACRPGDGITILGPDQWPALERTWKLAVQDLKVAKFVPASGAATRMFSFLREALESLGDSGRTELERSAAEGSAAALQALEFAEGIEDMPFATALASLALERGTALAELYERPLRLGTLVAGTDGLGLASLPKGLLPFHRYGTEARTAFEEHLHEAAGYACNRDNRVVVHFTVAEEHLPEFEAAARRGKQAVGQSAGTEFEIEFSTQDPSTDTLALGPGDAPLRSDAGRLVFRPAGHGALISNLARLGADVVFIKNIDNISPAGRHQEAAAWKRRLGGHLVGLRKQTFEILDHLEQGDQQAVDEALSFCRRYLTLGLPESISTETPAALRSFLIDRLDRPLRVCGVVKNVGEPGGGPFWVSEAASGESGQIVETSQIDMESAGQADILRGAGHFNPVDVACALSDRLGKPYKLSRFADPDTSFVATKLHFGRSIKALERPGLWNGAMAGWNTAFVEVPLDTFTPVKTILDLLRPEHRTQEVHSSQGDSRRDPSSP
jgi:hypothetical protein